MTLDEWCDRYERFARPFVKEGYDRMMCVSDRTMAVSEGWELYHLSDYVVTAVQAGTIWLAPRRNPLPCPMTLSVAAKDVKPGDSLYNPHTAHDAFRWVRVQSVSPDDRGWLRIETAAWWTVKHPEEAITVRRES